MNVGESIKYALDHYGAQEYEAAMLHACMAVDGTARKCYPELERQSRERFERLIRDNVEVFNVFAAQGVNLDETVFPLRLEDGLRHPRDAAFIIYKIHRCTHGHGDELPDGFELVPTEGDVVQLTVNVESGLVALSTQTILGLIAIALLNPVNSDQQIPMAYYLWQRLTAEDGRSDTIYLPIHQWWGRLRDFLEIVEDFRPGRVTMVFNAEDFDVDD